MNLKIVEENARTLAAAIGYSSQEAAELLDVTVALTYRENDLISGKLAGFLMQLLIRTVSNVIHHPDISTRCAVEIVIGDAPPRTEAPSLWISILSDKIVISDTRFS